MATQQSLPRLCTAVGAILFWVTFSIVAIFWGRTAGWAWGIAVTGSLAVAAMAWYATGMLQDARRGVSSER